MIWHVFVSRKKKGPYSAPGFPTFCTIFGRMLGFEPVTPLHEQLSMLTLEECVMMMILEGWEVLHDLILQETAGHPLQIHVVFSSSILITIVMVLLSFGHEHNISVAEPELEPEPVEPKLFWGAGAGTRVVISNFCSSSAAEIIFLVKILVILLQVGTVVSLENARMNTN